MRFSRQEHWSGLPCPPSGDLPNRGTEPRSHTLQVDSLPSEPPRKPMNTGMSSLSLLQGIFSTQGSPALQMDSSTAELPGKPRVSRVCVHAQSYLILCDPMDSSLPGSSLCGISRQECWSGFPLPLQGMFPTQDQTQSLTSPALAGRLFATGTT